MSTIQIESASRRSRFLLNYMDARHLTRLNEITIADRYDWMFHPNAWIDYKLANNLNDSAFITMKVLRDIVAYVYPNILRSRYREHLMDTLRRVWEDGDHVNGAWRNPRWNDNTLLTELFVIEDPAAVGGGGGSSNFLLVSLPVPEEDTSSLSSYRVRTIMWDNDYDSRDRSYSLVRFIFRPTSDTVVSSYPEEFSSLPRFWLQRNNYTFRPEYEHLTLDGDLSHILFGMELEISTRLSMAELQYIVTCVEPKQRPFFYGKSDSSITGRYRDNLIELVTMPCSPRFLKKNWSTFFKKLMALVPEGHTLGDYFDLSPNLNNGLHIHVSNDAFIGFDTNRGRNTTGRQKSLHHGRFMTALNQWTPEFQDWLQRITRRPRRPSDNEYCHVHRSFDGYTLARRIRRGTEGNSVPSDRHAACHTNGVTTEVRVWQGIFNIEHILSCIELTLAMINFTAYGNSRVNSMNFRVMFHDYVEKQQGYNYAKEVLRSCA